ncbi:hypothetical protein BBK36DRAFT_140258 [Trichoderma citrinoviride]|uniref:Uncharacterized protein n=1 Tax=Trichoderma citrinoviride TaxID=58853 RepID=A0A2T4BNU8_9HYPO|nr:hypothetical protein BBK36DRAFT_140258 [Trichoderma citrinoviride]PTB70994.1 hypothetical protein BBK36DRAFT_140258 [Trichoderma citrinoviride]
MATEPSTDNSADVFASTEPQSFCFSAPSSHGSVNGGSPLPEDIANKRITNVEDQINSADVSVSGGSDTEASRAKDGEKGISRAGSSAKKPTTFKAVSVNKTFLASKANPSVSSKTSDKPAAGSSTPPTGSATLSISRPRLVAKSGSGTGTSSPRFSSLANGGKPAAAPDPNAVWNKNRPTPAPEPKKFTDEELKKYGIHMASRLNEEDTQGQNKWADIDDDDDDWAPEVITWGDGTKTTLPHPDETAKAAERAASESAKEASPEKPSSPAPPATTSTPVPKSGGLPSGKGLVLKSAAQEKPVLVAKPPAPPAPAKSPWATLPPVKKASPGVIESAHPPRGSLRDSSFASNMTPLPHRDMGADDYSRSTWRDRSSYGNKELFNSRSGRYEPVPDRRPSMRSDSQTRYPALLQRGGPLPDHPAEPSAAFQTSRTAPDAPFGRRRGSSNVSGGSGSYLQRLSKGHDGHIPPGPEFLGVRRGSAAGSVLESPVSPVAVSVMSQGQSRHQPLPDATSRPSPGTSYAAPHHGNSHPEQPVAPPSHRLEDDIEFQKKLMREGIEQARKRRQEEEAREEAARRERIQKKLEAMGPPPEKKTEAKEAPKEQGAKPAPSQQPAPSDQTSAPPTAKANHPHQTDSGRNDAAGVPHIEKPGFGHKDAPSTSTVPPAGPANRRLSHSQDAEPTSVWGSRPDRFSSWAAGTPRNVWSSPDNDNGLGNGTFNPQLSRVAGASAQPASAGNAPAPIAPPTTIQSSHNRNQVPAPIGSRAARYGNMGAELANKWVSAVVENDKRMNAEKLAERTGRERQLAERGISVEDAQPTIKDTWRPVHIPGDGTRRAVSSSEPQLKNTEDPIMGGQPGVLGNGAGSSVLPPNGPTTTPQSRPSRFFPTRDVRAEVGTIEPLRPSTPSPPPPTMEGHPVYEGDHTRPHVSLPKPQPVVKLPPAMQAAQALQAKASNPWTNRAPSREISRAPIPHAYPARRVSETSQGNWQDKINNLLNGGKASPPKHMGIDPSSRNALDHTSHQQPTTVSLPAAVTVQHTTTESPQTLTSKPMAEECFEEQEMGSLPRIRLPHNAPEAAWQPAASIKPMPKRFYVQPSVVEPYYFHPEVAGGGNAVRIYFPGMSEPRTATIPFSAARGGGRGSHRPSSRHRGGGHGPRGGGGAGGGGNGSGNGNGNSKREFSNSYGDAANPSSGSRGSRGGYRSRGSDNWNRFSQPREQGSSSN